jgi:hypothetical protein
MFQLNGQLISIDGEITVDGIRYPHLRDPALREQLGVVEVADPEIYDQRFYWGPNNPKLLEDREESDEDGNPLFVKVLGEVDGEPAMVDSDRRLVTRGLKYQWTGQVKQTAGSLLAQTDWMVLRKAERGVEIPEDTASFRAAVLAEANRLEDAITVCATVEELIEVVNAQSWPTVGSLA